MNLPDPKAFFNHEYHELIGLIYDAVTAEQGFFPFLRRFVQIFQGHSATFAIYNTAESSLLGAWTVNIPEESLRFYSEHVAHCDVLVERAMSVYHRGEWRFVASNLDLGLDGQRLRSKTQAKEWLQSYGATDAAGAVVYMEGHYLNFFGIQRSSDQPAFSYGELQVFDGFLPHLHRAVSLYTQLMQKRIGSSVERLALDRVNSGIIICDASFQVVFRNARADDFLAKDVGLRLNDDNMLVAYGNDSARQFSALLSSAVEASVTGRNLEGQVLSLEQGQERVTLVVMPLSEETDAGGMTQGALVTLHDWSCCPNIENEWIQKLFGLTEAEAAIASALIEGRSLPEIAAMSGRSRETVKYHLNNVFRKTSTRRQSELVALLTRALTSVLCVLPGHYSSR
ncbi:helix-turn-helix transcriptional regulator [Marinobacter sp.]|uniref:helix-turn-helix transcriptional regulator n=1 Tax=Marinobacter sp. TaxID=50741 RepID=UPI003564C124